MTFDEAFELSMGNALPESEEEEDEDFVVIETVTTRSGRVPSKFSTVILF